METRNVKKGQTVLFVLLISAVVAVIGLSMSKKTVVETKINSDEELLKQAFNSAESGIDYYLKTGETTYESEDKKQKAEIIRTSISAGNNYVFEELTLDSRKGILWLAAHDSNGNVDEANGYNGGSLNITVKDGDNNDFVGAIEVDYYYRDADGKIKVTRKGYNLKNSNLISGFESVSDSFVSGFQTNGTPLLITIMPLGRSAWITIDSASDFPDQGELITSVGKAGDVSTSPVSRKVKLSNKFKFPFFMLEAVTAGGQITN